MLKLGRPKVYRLSLLGVLLVAKCMRSHSPKVYSKAVEE